MLAKEIRDNWTNYPSGYAAAISSIVDQGYKAWSLKRGNEYGVAIPIVDSSINISENFAGARLYTDNLPLSDGRMVYVLLLTAITENISVPFSTLCAELVNPGDEGVFRKEIISNPTRWWTEWKELLGNRNVDERVYDVLGELYTLRHLAQMGFAAVWDGPTGATYDIDCDGTYYEVKSTVARNKREIAINNPYQLSPPSGHALYLVLCQFERATRGISINCLVEDLVKLGYSRSDIEGKLTLSGLECGKTLRSREYIVHAVTKYIVDEKFPKITDEKFIDGVRPKGIKTYSYVVDLDSVPSETLECKQENKNEI